MSRIEMKMTGLVAQRVRQIMGAMELEPRRTDGKHGLDGAELLHSGVKIGRVGYRNGMFILRVYPTLMGEPLTNRLIRSWIV